MYDSAVAIVFDDEHNILVGKSTHDGDRKGKMCMPGGGVKKGEDVIAAAVRECREETGIKVKAVSDPIEAEHDDDVAFVICIKTGGTIKPNSEFDNMKWLPLEEATTSSETYAPNRKLLKEIHKLTSL